ncbi:MAG: PAS domain S-box protein, partial [Anaerolineales bacterium]|nr:PAS domain S-box protein [Anaerolineales bacterium]
GLKSIAILPMQAQGRVWGGINIASHTLKQVPAFARFALETLSTELANIFIHLQTEAKLRESEARYRLLFETMVQGVVFQDAEGQIIHANPSAERILGLTVEEMRGLTSRDPLWGVIHEDGSPFPGETHPAMIALQTGQPVYNVVMGVLNASLNTYRWLHVNAIPRFNPEDHKPYQVYTTFEDITESKEAKNALETSEKKFISLIASQTHYVIRVNMEGKYTYWNAQFEKEFGWLHEPHGFLNANAMLTTCEYHRERVFEVSMQCMANPGQAFSVEIDKPAKGGGVRTTLWEFICLTDEHNQPSEIQCMGMDISDRKRAEEALRRMEMRYRALIENAPDGIVLVTPDGHFKYGSPSVERIFGYVQAQIPELSPNDLTHPDDLPIVLATLYEVIQNPHQTSTLQYRFLHRRGEWRWIESTFSNLLAVPGVEAIAINFTDVTERRQAETALRESEARAQAMLQAIPDLMFRLDREGVFLDYKADVKELYDQSGASLIGKRNRDIAPPAFAELIDHFIQTTLETGSLQTFEYQLTLPEQGPQVYEARMTPSGPNEVLAIVRNITERKKAEEALRAREELYRLISTINADYIFSTDVALNGDMTLKWVGGGFETITGYTFDEYLAIGGWRATLHPDDLPIDDQNTATLKNNQKLSSELRTYHKNGQLHWVQVHANPLWDDEHQRLKGVYGTVQDITARKKAETALHLSEEKYRVLLESLDNVIATVNEEGQFLFLNDTAAAQLGGTVAQFTGKTMHELFPPDIATLQMDLVRKTIQENHSQIYETITMIQSQPRWHRTSILPMQDENGNITRALISSTDIHDLKTAQEDLQELNHTLEQRVQQRTAEVQDLYENSPIGYHSLDPHGIIIRINQTHLDWLGYTREEMLGHAFTAFLPPPGVHLFQQVYPPFMQNGSMRDVEFDLLRKDGTIISVLISATGIYDEQGRFIMSRTTVFDNTERKLTNEALRQANLELERSMRLKDEFLANMSHELRTPLNAILAFSEGLLEQYRGPLNEKQLLSVKNIETSGRHLLALITDILDLSKIEAGHLDLQIQDIALADVAEASLLFIKEIASKKNLKLAFHLNDHLAIVEADPKRLKQMLVNLLSNAVKFTPSDGQISLQVTTNSEEKTVTFTVADTGIGIAPEDLPRLFQPFTQLDSSLSRQHEGTGLGLVLVQRLAQLHGGTISVQSIPNKGSQFTITLPYHPPVFPHPTPSHPPHKGVTGPLNAHPATLPNLTPIRILLAEDNDFNTQAIQDYLQDKGYQITTARDGRSAIESAQQTHPHLILMDIQMPEMDGLEAIRQLRATPAFAHTPIIALTALAMPGDRERCLSAGANEYLVKPVSLKDLVETIQIMLADKDFTQ